MSVKVATIIVLILALGQMTNGLFFGLFGSSKPVRKPDAVVSEYPKTETDNIAYGNYLRLLASTYYAPANLPPPTPLQYFPLYTYQPQLYSKYIQPQQNLMYHDVISPRNLNTATASIQYNYQPVKARVDLPTGSLGSPIIVLPSTPYEASSSNSAPGGNNKLNELIEESSSQASKTDTLSGVKTRVFEIPEPQISATLYDLPVSGISPDYNTGGYLTKMMTASSAISDNTRLGKKFGHAYENEYGTKVSEEGQLVQYENGKDTVLKRGQYEYIDANGKPVSVKWVADDNGFRLVN